MGLLTGSTNAIAACLLLGAGDLLFATAQNPSGSVALPTLTSLSELEIRVDRGGSGGCIGRCVLYRITVRGDGTVTYEDLADPPVAPRERTVPVDDVVALANEFVRARFFDASDRYVGGSVYVRRGDQLLLGGTVGADGPTWDLSIRLGRLAKTVHLYLDYPEALAKLRDHVEQIGGPQAWTGR
jgi:Domain of unknown function (DUF6438)